MKNLNETNNTEKHSDIKTSPAEWNTIKKP
jgi:hypothetical protein